jgi:hypothetical protein
MTVSVKGGQRLIKKPGQKLGQKPEKIREIELSQSFDVGATPCTIYLPAPRDLL